MKQYLVYKKQFSIVFFICAFFCFCFFYSSAETISELNSKIEQKNTDIEKLEQEIKQYQNQLNDIGKQKSSLSSSIAELDLTRKKLVADISITQSKIDKTNLKIKELSFQIVNKESSIANNEQVIKLDLKKTSELEAHSLLEIILSKDDFTDIWNDISNMVSLRKKLKEEIIELQNIKVGLEDTRKETTDAKNELIRLQNELSDRKKIVDQNTAEKKKLLTQTKNNEANYQTLLKDRLAKKAAFEKELQDYESQLQYILDPSTLPGKSTLSWPVDSVYVTQLFGVTSASKRLYASGSHSGVDFRAAVGTPVKAVADGIVAGVGDTDKTCAGASFGKFIFIKHNNGLSTAYGHLSLIKVAQGASVKRGQVIGYSGNTGHTTGPHLHLTVYAADAARMENRPSSACEGKSYYMPIAPTSGYLDPMYYLPPYK